MKHLGIAASAISQLQNTVGIVLLIGTMQKSAVQPTSKPKSMSSVQNHRTQNALFMQPVHTMPCIEKKSIAQACALQRTHNLWWHAIARPRKKVCRTFSMPWFFLL